MFGTLFHIGNHHSKTSVAKAALFHPVKAVRAGKARYDLTHAGRPGLLRVAAAALPLAMLLARGRRRRDVRERRRI